MRRIFFIIFGATLLVIVIALFYDFKMPKFNKENKQIEAWITANNLNEYGDLANTVYSNGKPVESPLVSARYDYIKRMHPDSPWNK